MEFKVGNRYRVLQGCSTFTLGSEVELKELVPGSTSRAHLYTLITGECVRDVSADGRPGGFIHSENVENIMTIGTDRSYQTTDELVQENRSLLRQVQSLLKRKEALAIEVGSLGDRIKRKKAFRASNIKALKSQSIGV